MARKSANYTVETEGRDHGKVFVITEMSAARAESWAMRVMLALMGNNSDLPEGFETLGMAGLTELGLKSLSGLKWEVAQPLLAEMLECVEVIPDPKKTHVKRALIEDDIEEVATRLKLRMEVFQLHTDFLQAGVSSMFPTKQATAAVKGRDTKTPAR